MFTGIPILTIVVGIQAITFFYFLYKTPAEEENETQLNTISIETFGILKEMINANRYLSI